MVTFLLSANDIIYYYTGDFKGDIIKTDFPTNSTIELNLYAQIGLKAIFREGYHYKKAGVIVMELTPNSETQLSLFNISNPKHQPLMSVIDKLNKSYGNNKVKFATQSSGRQWKMKQEKLSPCYSTRINDVVNISVDNTHSISII